MVASSVLALVGGACAFSPAVGPAPIVRPARAAPHRAAPPSLLLSPAKLAISVPTLYALMSVNEYATHRWYQHEEFNRDHFFQRFCQRVANVVKGRPLTLEGPTGPRANTIKLKGGGHVEHHAETYDDMSLKKDARWRRTPAAASLDADEFRGTAFTWATSGLMTIQMLPTALPAFALLGFSLLETAAVLLPGMLVHALVWNMLHPPMHGLPPVPLGIGAPSKWPFRLHERLLNSGYFKYIYENHQGHHVLGGQANYNVCCPGFDYVMQTRVPTKDWLPKMRAVPGADATERWGLPVEPIGVPQAPVIGAGKATEADLTPTALAAA